MPQIYKHNAGIIYKNKILSLVSLEINVFYLCVIVSKSQLSCYIFRISSMTPDI